MDFFFNNDKIYIQGVIKKQQRFIFINFIYDDKSFMWGMRVKAMRKNSKKKCYYKRSIDIEKYDQFSLKWIFFTLKDEIFDELFVS